MSTQPKKRCSQCGKYFPATTEYFYSRQASKDGFRADCKICHNNNKEKYRTNNREIIAEKKGLYYRENKAQITQKAKEYREQNLERLRERDRKYHLRNRDHRNQQVREWQGRNRDYIRLKNREWKQSHSEYTRQKNSEWYRENREVSIKKAAEWRKKHPARFSERTRIETSRRRARIRNLPDTFSQKEWQYALTYFHKCCAVCGRQLNGMFHTAAADHWIPLSSPNCPGTIKENIIPLCHGENGCNNRKQDKDPEQWLTETFGKRKAQEILARITAYFDHLRSLSD